LPPFTFLEMQAPATAGMGARAYRKPLSFPHRTFFHDLMKTETVLVHKFRLCLTNEKGRRSPFALEMHRWANSNFPGLVEMGCRAVPSCERSTLSGKGDRSRHPGRSFQRLPIQGASSVLEANGPPRAERKRPRSGPSAVRAIGPLLARVQ
jgi:hypothetical protein